MIKISLALTAVLVAASAHAETFKISFYDPVRQKDETVNVKLHAPASAAASKPAVILMGGCDGSLSDGALHLIKELTQSGVLVAELQSLDWWSGRGQSCTRTSLLGVKRAEQAFITRDELVKRGLANENRVGLLGFSHGGWAITHAMYNDTTSQYHVKKPFASAVAYYPHCQTLDVARYDLKVPTLMFGGGQDTWTPVSVCERMLELTKQATTDSGIPVEFVVYPEATHSFDNNKPPRSVQTMKGLSFLAYDPAATKDAYVRTMQWFKKHLL